MGRRMLVLGLAVSAAFNVGFIGTAAYRCYRAEPMATDCMPACLRANPEFQDRAERLRIDLEPLRRRQAAETRRLAELIHASETDQAEIDRSLDRLASAGRAVHARVVETVLEQRDTLPEDQRAAYCILVRRRLCDPWAGCEPAACTPKDHQHQPQPHGGTQ